MKLGVWMIDIRLPDWEIVFTSGLAEFLDNVNITSLRVTYIWNRPRDSSYDRLTHLEYFSQYPVDVHLTSSDVH
jgi:hypothetical protein